MESHTLKRRIYVLCRPIFSGRNAQVRKAKKIRELVETSQAALQPLLQDITICQLVDTLRSLLKKKIFQSELRAKIEFPDLFVPSPLRDTQREESEADAARYAAEVLDGFESEINDEDLDETAEDTSLGHEGNQVMKKALTQVSLP